jgi:protein-disulfide isomerase
MPITRRSALALVGSTILALPALARAEGNSTPAPLAPPYTQRALGAPTAPVTVQEYFSLTCTHCAEFATVTMPKVKQNLIDTGEVQFIYHDFPLDQVALKAAQVARYLPEKQYYPFVEALFASQDDWAFQPNEDYHAALFKYAALAGMDQKTFDTAWKDDKLAQFILSQQQEAQKLYNITATPTFIINGKLYPGAMSYDDFAAAVAAAKSAKG